MKDAESEKKMRGRVLSAVERHLSKNDLVICDHLNYIKGFRYQLYCVARALGTPSCTVLESFNRIKIHCGVRTSDSLDNNETNIVYDPGMIENLCSRYEEPDGRHFGS